MTAFSFSKHLELTSPSIVGTNMPKSTLAWFMPTAMESPNVNMLCCPGLAWEWAAARGTHKAVSWPLDCTHAYMYVYTVVDPGYTAIDHASILLLTSSWLPSYRAVFWVSNFLVVIERSIERSSEAIYVEKKTSPLPDQKSQICIPQCSSQAQEKIVEYTNYVALPTVRNWRTETQRSGLHSSMKCDVLLAF